MTFRDLILQSVPWWLRGSLGSRILFAIGLQADALGEALGEGVRRRFPGLDSDDSLALIGHDRRIARGRTEAAANYSKSLIRWLDDHAVRGGAYAMLRRLNDFYAGRSWAIHLLYRSGRRHSLGTTGTITYDTFAWDPDNDPNWARWWLMHTLAPEAYSSDGDWTPFGTWDDGELWDSVSDTWDGTIPWDTSMGAWDDDGTWDTTLSEAQVEDLRVVPRNFDNAHSSGKVVAFGAGTDLWDYPPTLWDDTPGVWTDHGPLILSV